MDSSSNDILTKAFLVTTFVVCLVAIIPALLSGCTDEESTRRTLENAGYTDVQTTGYEMFSCGEDDTYQTGFIATNPKGKRVKGVVCCGLIAKGCTIRY